MKSIKVLTTLLAIITTNTFAVYAENITLSSYYPDPRATYGNTTTGNLTTSLAGSQRCALGTLTLPGDGKLVVSGRIASGQGTSIVINSPDVSHPAFVTFGEMSGGSSSNLSRLVVCDHATCTVGSMMGSADFNAINYVSNAPITFNTRSTNSSSSSEKMRVQGNGNVGIGTMNPTARLQVNGTVRLRGFHGTGLTVNSSGNVGIGTTSPAAPLDVRLPVRVSTSDANSPSYSFARNPNTGFYLADPISVANYTLIFATNGAERMRITNTGLIGIGTNSPVYRLELPNIDRPAGRGRAAAWTVYSSKKYKKDVAPLNTQDYSSTLKEIEKMDLVYYRYKDQNTKRRNLGVIAENSPKQFITEDRDSMNITELTAFTVAGLKALTEEVKTLETNIKNKEKENREIKTKLERLEKMFSVR